MIVSRSSENASIEDSLSPWAGLRDLSQCCDWFFRIDHLRELLIRNEILFHRDVIMCCGKYPITLIPIDLLRPHEETEASRLIELRNDILSRRVLEKPILVDLNTMIILDGHHRYRVLRDLGKKRIPSLLIDYNDSCVEVSSWRSDWVVSKDLVLRSGLSGKLLPHKTSRHKLCFEVPVINLSIDDIP